jgi:hypothetical protein
MATRKRETDPSAAQVPADAVSKLRVAREQGKAWAEAEKAAKAEILEALGDKTVGKVGDATAVIVKTVKQSRIDVTALRKDEPEIAALFTVATPVTRVELVGNADDGDE